MSKSNTSRASTVIELCVALAVLCMSGCASKPVGEGSDGALGESDRKERTVAEILSQPLEQESYSETRRCLTTVDYRDFHVIDDKRIVFEGRRGQLWLNTLRSRCPELRRADVLETRSDFVLDRVCDLDTFVAREWFDRPWYRRAWPRGDRSVRCVFGEFQSVTQAQVDAIERAVGGP